MSEATELSEQKRRKIIHYKTALESFKVELKDFEGNKKDKILELAKLLEDSGHPKETISEKVGDDLSGYLSRRYVREVLGNEYKDPKQVRNQAQTVPSSISERGTSSAIVTNEDNQEKQPLLVTNNGETVDQKSEYDLDDIHGGKSLEQMRREAQIEIEEDEEGTLENPANMLRQTPNPAKESLVNNNNTSSLSTPTTTRLLSDTPPGVRDMEARISELEEALRIQKEEAETKGKRYFELKRKYLQNSPENLRRENAELKVMLNNLKTLNEETTINNNESVKEELGYKEVELFKLDSTKVTWLLKTSKESERTVFLVINPKSMQIVDVKTDKEMHRIQVRRKHEQELVQEAAKAVTTATKQQEGARS